MDRFTVLSESAKSNGINRLLLEKAFAGSSLESFDNGSDIADVICWDEGFQSAILFLNEEWKAVGFTWNDEEHPEAEWKDSPKLAQFFDACILYACKNDIPLDELGCRDGDAVENEEQVIPGQRHKNLLNELRQTLEDNHCLMEDVAYAEMMSRDGSLVCISPAIFNEMASEIDYVDGSMTASIHPDLKIVLKDGSFIGRMWADGSEWFRFWKHPEMDPEMANLGRDDLCFFSHEAAF